MCLADFAGNVPDIDVAGPHDLRTNTAKAKRLAKTGIDEDHRINAESSGEFLAACMRRLSDLDDGIAEGDLRPWWQIVDTKIHIDK